MLTVVYAGSRPDGTLAFLIWLLLISLCQLPSLLHILLAIKAEKECDEMSHSGSSSPQSRWKQVEALLGTKLPELPEVSDTSPLTDTSWVDEYVQQMLKKTMPVNGMLSGLKSKAEIFETHHYVIVKFKLPQPANPIVRARADRVSIEDSPLVKKQNIKLPCLVVPRLSKASYKNGILQIKMRKQKINQTAYDIYVRYL
ncbi:Hsp20/alpha crystallin family protein [Paenibacillus sp. WQ 127069]|uniref:Hsp20/alpha crystallin family protein n=2 Tax=Paenibacillus baimaensis TaxID=2982185 RepID=A0ABT2UL97_9BACL|nr:Hsp20/alpha crystallin family protein [Paenibacillus sp. WQ 127069]